MATAEWTIMIFLNADNNLEPFGLKDFREMAKIGSTDKVNVVVQFDRNGGWATTSPQWKGCYRFKVEKNMAPLPAQAVASLGDTNMGNGATLRNFVDWAMTTYPAKKYMLAVWNHGQGWRHFQTVRPNVNGLELSRFRDFRASRIAREAARQERSISYRRRGQTAVPEPTQAIPLDLTVSGAVRSVSSDDTSRDTLYNREIQECLRGVTLDVIGFDACLMAMVETGYALRDAGRVMVASEELEPGDGWNYEDWLGTLVQTPDMSAADLGKVMVDSYRNHYEGPGNEPATTLSAIDLSKMSGLAASIDGLADALTNLGSNEFNGVIAARQACEEYAPGYGLHGVDLGRFAEQAKASVGGANVGPAADAVAQSLTDSVIANYAGADRSGSFGSKGLSIYFPETRANFNADPDNEGYIKTNAHYPVEFVQNHRWADFLLNRYLSGVNA
jgi:hypothetical protein